MPKKKQKLDKRLDRLFEGIKPDAAVGKPKQSTGAAPNLDPNGPTPARRIVPASRPAAPYIPTTRVESLLLEPGNDAVPASLSLAFQMDQTTWATLQATDETNSRSWSLDEQMLVKQVTDQLSLALENARLFQETQKRAEEMALINRIVTLAAASLDMRKNLGAVAEEITSALSIDATTLSLITPQRDAMDVIANFSHKSASSGVGSLHPLSENHALQAILESGKTMVIHDVPHKPLSASMKAVLDEIGTQTLAILPMMSKGQPIGLVGLHLLDASRVFTPDELTLAQTICSQISTAVENARLFQDVQDRVTQQEVITQITEAALNASTIPELIGSIHRAVGRVVPARNFYIALYDWEQDVMTFPYYVDEHDSAWPDQKLGHGLTSYVIRNGKSLLATPEIYANLERSGEVMGGGTKGVDWLGVPLRTSGAVRGVMAIQSYDPTVRLTEKHRDLLAALGTQAAAAIERLQSRAALSKSESDLRALFASMEDVVLVVDRDARYLRIAPTNPSRLIRPANELLGKLMEEFVPPDTAIRFKQAIAQTLDTGETVQIEYELPVQGKIFWFLASLSRLDANTAFWVARDITSRRQAEGALQRRNAYLAASAEISRLVTSTLDLQTIFSRTVNLVAERFDYYHAAIFIIEETRFHANLEAATGQAGETMKAQTHRLPVGSTSVVGEVTQTGSVVVVNDTYGSTIHRFNPLLPRTRAETAIPLRVGNRIIGALDIQADHTDAFSEDDIAVLQTLADQVAIAIDNARSYELSVQAVKEMREVDRLKSQFLANMSHELRTPLNSIIGFSRVILKGIDGPVTELQQSDLTAIYNSGQHLLGLINDILDLSKIEAGKMDLAFEDVNISDVISSVLSTVTGLVKDKPIRLVKNVPASIPHVHADPIRVRQVLINLFSNAAKFTDEGEITVDAIVQAGPAGQPEVCISVTDTGPGIDEKDQTKLFQAFSQVDDSPTRRTGGSGLGLSICQRLIHMHGGQIGLHSSPGKGSTFYFTLPVHQEPVERLDAGPLILAIDDDPQVISLYERYLQAGGYQVAALTDPSRAVERVAELKPFAITLDIMMPGVDGWQVLTSLKSHPETRDIPVIICSIIEEQERGFSLGAADYLVKPILEEDMVRALNRLNGDGSIREVLVVGDDPNDLGLMGKMLNDQGRYRPILAQGGEKGWEILNRTPPQAVILDLFMTEMNGFQFLEKMRANKALADIPVIIVSGADLTPAQQQQLNEFGQQLVTKGSLSEKELITSLESALGRLKAR